MIDREQVMQWARETAYSADGMLELERFAALAYAAGQRDEREACAKLCESLPDRFDGSCSMMVGKHAAATIRARGVAP